MLASGVKQFAVVLLVAVPALAAELKPKTLQAFDRYTRAAEGRIEQRLSGGSFLWAAEDPGRLALLRAGRVVIQPLVGKGEMDVANGLIHDWIGAVFVGNVDLATVLAAVQDYDHHKYTHRPEVIDSKLLRRDGNDFKIYLRVWKKKVVTVVLDTEHDVRYFPLDATRCHSRSYSTRIAEVQDPGKPNERERPPGQGHGFLWRLYSYWRFQQRDGGVYIECEAISLTRDVPTGLGWIIVPIIRNLPRESLENTLSSTRTAVLERQANANHANHPD